MKHKVSELDGVLLDCAVAECRVRAGSDDPKWFYRWELISDEKSMIGRAYCSVDAYNVAGAQYEPSTDWTDGGPIIQRERISLDAAHDHVSWMAQSPKRDGVWVNGPTPLVAAMRAYVASKLGDEVDLP